MGSKAQKYMFLSALLLLVMTLFGCGQKEEFVEDNIGNEVEYDEKTGVYSVQGVDVIKSSNSESTQSTASNQTATKRIYLTFDDGPSIYTDDILDILAKYNVKATFFVYAKDNEKLLPKYKRIVDEGHSIGMHSYSHKYKEVYGSEESFKEDLSKIQEFIYTNTGVWSRIYRFPGGSSNRVSKIPMEKFIHYLNEEGIRYFDWNISSQDAVKGSLSEETILRNCTRDIDKYDDCIILMHDAASRKTTLKALDDIIETINARGDCEFLPITDETPVVQHKKEN